MNVTPETHVATLATRHPGTLRVFQRHGIDFCCGGKRPLAEACAEHGLELSALQEELTRAMTPDADDGRDWSRAPLRELVAHIVQRYHERLREDLPRLGAMAEKVLSVHGDKHPDVLPDLAATFRRLQEEMEAHTLKEEMVLFPHIRRMERSAEDGTPMPQAAFDSVDSPIAMMEAEHTEVAHALAHLRDLTGGFEPPKGACTTFRGLYHGLAELEADTHRHIHLENNVLFPRSLEMERSAVPAA